MVSTFTFFDVPAGTTEGAKRAAVRSNAPSLPVSSTIADRSELFLHRLVSCCDYSFNTSRTPEGHIVAEIGVTIDRRARRGATYRWDPEKMTLGELDAARGRSAAK
jgi:hypothetical protein